MLYVRWTCEWGVREGWVRVLVLYVCSKLQARPAGEEIMRWVRGPGSRQGCWADRGAVLVLEGSVNLLEKLESAVCAFTSELLSLPAIEQEGVSAVCVLCEPCV